MQQIPGIGPIFQPSILIGIAVVVIALMIVFRKYASALSKDFFLDGFLSALDEPLNIILDFIPGVGSIPTDIGDLVAAVVIYKTEKHHVGPKMALVMALEALAFFIEPILEMIPFIGAGMGGMVGMFFNALPTVTIVRAIYGKSDIAIAEKKLLEEEIKIAKAKGLKHDKEEKILKQIDKLLHKHWSFEADKLYSKEQPQKELGKRIHNMVEAKITSTAGVIDQLLQEDIQAPPELISILEQGVVAARQLLNQSQQHENKFVRMVKHISSHNAAHDVEEAYILAEQAHNVLMNAIEMFQQQYEQWEAAMQEEEFNMQNEYQQAA